MFLPPKTRRSATARLARLTNVLSLIRERRTDDIHVRWRVHGDNGWHTNQTEIFWGENLWGDDAADMSRLAAVQASIFGKHKTEVEEGTGRPIRRTSGFVEQVGRLPRAGDEIELCVLRSANSERLGGGFRALFEAAVIARPMNPEAWAERSMPRRRRSFTEAYHEALAVQNREMLVLSIVTLAGKERAEAERIADALIAG